MNNHPKEKPKAFDHCPDDDFIKKTAILFKDKHADLTSLSMFDGKKSKEFYLGFWSGINAALSAMQMFPIPHIQDALSEIQISALIKASEKTSTIISPFN